MVGVTGVSRTYPREGRRFYYELHAHHRSLAIGQVRGIRGRVRLEQGVEGED